MGEKGEKKKARVCDSCSLWKYTICTFTIYWEIEWLYNQSEEFEDQQENEADTVSAEEIIAETAKLVWDIYCIWTDDDYYYYNDD